MSRQPDLVEVLCGITSEQLKDSPTWGEQGAYDWADLHRALWQQRASFTRHPAFVAVERDCLGALERGELARDVELLTVSYYTVLHCLEHRDELGFAHALAEALRQHKLYWGATEKRRNNNEGLVSLQLTTAAALAWDQGMRFEVESDYLPASWVSGSLFREGTGGAPT